MVKSCWPFWMISSRQLCCRGMCKNLLWSDGRHRNYSKAKFPLYLNCGQKIVSETGPRPVLLTLLILHGWKVSVSWLNSVTKAQIFFTISIMKNNFQSQFSHGSSFLLSPLILVIIYPQTFIGPCNGTLSNPSPKHYVSVVMLNCHCKIMWLHEIVLSDIQCKPDISRSCISRNWIYRGRMLDPIFLPTDFANFADEPKSTIFFVKSR